MRQTTKIVSQQEALRKYQTITHRGDGTCEVVVYLNDDGTENPACWNMSYRNANAPKADKQQKSDSKTKDNKGSKSSSGKAVGKFMMRAFDLDDEAEDRRKEREEEMERMHQESLNMKRSVQNLCEQEARTYERISDISTDDEPDIQQYKSYLKIAEDTLVDINYLYYDEDDKDQKTKATKQQIEKHVDDIKEKCARMLCREEAIRYERCINLTPEGQDVEQLRPVYEECQAYLKLAKSTLRDIKDLKSPKTQPIIKEVKAHIDTVNEKSDILAVDIPGASMSDGYISSMPGSSILSNPMAGVMDKVQNSFMSVGPFANDPLMQKQDKRRKKAQLDFNQKMKGAMDGSLQKNLYANKTVKIISYVVTGVLAIGFIVLLCL